MSTMKALHQRIEAELQTATAELGKLKVRAKNGEAGAREHAGELESAIGPGKTLGGEGT